MTEPIRPEDGPDQVSGASADVPQALVALLAATAIWEDPDPRLEDAVVAVITAEAARADREVDSISRGTAREHVPRTLSDLRRRGAPTAIGAALGVAAAMVLFVAAMGLDLVRLDLPRDQPPSVEVALDAVDLGPPDAWADAELQSMPEGTRIVLQIGGLPPADEDEWYELVLLRPDEPPVSAGSFHLRGGGGAVVLWAGIDAQDGLVVEVTKQPQGTLVLSGGQ